MPERFILYGNYIGTVYESKTHVVLLVAGASSVAIPNGDRNGRMISAVRVFVEKLGLTSIISDFEDMRALISP